MKQYEKEFKKGKELDKSFDKSIMDCLMECVTVTREPNGFPHDTIVKFKKNVKLKVSVSYE